MLERLERQKKLTANQWRIILTANLGDMLDFFDFFLMGMSCIHPEGVAHHIRPIGDHSDLGRSRGGAWRLLLGLDGRPHRPLQPNPANVNLYDNIERLNLASIRSYRCTVARCRSLNCSSGSARRRKPTTASGIVERANGIGQITGHIS